MKDRKRKTKPVTAGSDKAPGRESQDKDFKITSRKDREKKLRLDAAWNRSEALSEKLFGGNDSGAGKYFGYIFFGFYYLFPVKEKKERKNDTWLIKREKNLREKIHKLAETLPQLIYDKTTLLFVLGGFAIAVLSFFVTGNLLWLFFTSLGILSLIASTISLKYGIKGWFLAMILFLAMLGFFLEPKVIHRGLPELYKIFQIW